MFSATWSLGLEGFERPRAVREAVFVQELGIPEAEEFDWWDGVAAHLFVAEGGSGIAAGRMYPDGEAIRLGNICVLPKFREQPFFELVLRTMLFKAQQLPMPAISVYAESHELVLYLPFGFAPARSAVHRGRPCTELTVPRQGVVWHSKCGGC